MSKVKLIFGTYNAVPAGETEHLFEDAYQKAFKPFLTSVYNHPEIRPSIFYSGPLLEWLEKRHPEFQTVLAELSSNKTIGFLGGGYWEPMLPLIPASDRVGQIEVMTTYLRKRFGKRPRGSWINAQVWEANLASSLRSSGMDYVLLTENAFPAVPGFRNYVPVIAEDQGKMVTIFPVMDSLASRFLKVPPEHILDSMKSLASANHSECVVTLMLNGFELGGDGSSTVCYGEKWLERFFRSVEDSRDWLECVHPGKYLRNAKLSREKVYVPGPSYDSLMRWTRSGRPETSVRNESPVRGGCHSLEPGSQRSAAYYREFLAKYRESSLLYSKMMYIEVLTNQLRGDRYRKKNAKEELWRGQEHYAYWHGPTGGVYSSRLRHAAYAALIEAEKATRERGIFKAALTSVDFDMDGEKEFLYNGLIFNAYVHSVGGTLFELDYLPESRNYLATLARYPEDYHPPATREQGYDAYPRHAFLDHVFLKGSEPENFESSAFRRESAFPKLRYGTMEVVRDQPRVTLGCEGPLNNEPDALGIVKTYRFRRNTLEVDYTFVNRTPRTQTFSWGPEINLALSDDETLRSLNIAGERGERTGADERGQDEDVGSWTVFDNERDVMMHFVLSEPASLRRLPVHADYRVGRELRRNYQSSFFMPVWSLSIAPMDSHFYRITMRIGRHKNR